MRTTIDINDALLQAAKSLAARERRTLKAVVEQALRELLSGPKPGVADGSPIRGLLAARLPTGNRIPDAYHAALAIDHGCEWVTPDRGFHDVRPACDAGTRWTAERPRRRRRTMESARQVK